jgi:hypothetical protein
MKERVIKNRKVSMSMSLSIMLSEELLSGMSKMINEIVSKAVRHCGVKHNFDAELMLRELNIEDIAVCVGVAKPVKAKEVKAKEVKAKEVKAKEVKSKYPLPFSGVSKVGCCQALRQNHGLYTQCETKVNSEETYCKKCGPSPQFGTIQQRLEVGLMDFRDSNGKAPIAFTKVMKKLKISRSDVEEEASKLNIEINPIHFEEEKREKGRPKKAKKTVELVEDNSPDLFAALVAKANAESDDSDSEEEESVAEKLEIAESIVDSVLDKVSVIAENNEKKAEKEALKAAEKAEKEALKEAEKQKKEAEKQALLQKKEAEKALKEAEKQALLQKKEAEKALKEAEKQKKEASKPAAKAVKSKKESSDSETDKKKSKPAGGEKKAAKEAEEEEDVVKRFEFEGVKYLKSKKTGIIYNMDQDVVGKWNEKTCKIDFEEADSEEEEDEYDA